MLDYQIRACQPNDLPVLVQLCQKHAHYEQASYTRAGKEERLQKALFGESPPLHGLVVEAGGELVGYATYTFDYSTWNAAPFLHLDCLYLEPAYRGRGIGERIIRQLEQVARERGCVNMQWQTPAFNEKAIRFYKRISASGKEKIRFSLATANEQR